MIIICINLWENNGIKSASSLVNNGKQQLISSFSSESAIGNDSKYEFVIILAESVVLFDSFRFLTYMSHGLDSKPLLRLILIDSPGNAKASNRSY